MPNPIPAEWLPQATVKLTVIWVHPEYDDTVECVTVGRDWISRGEDYLRGLIGLEEDTRIVAVFEGWHSSRLGSAINM
jgi:predicted hotdog family 3-hydroxylacyl-ACP dehydratase